MNDGLACDHAAWPLPPQRSDSPDASNDDGLPLASLEHWSSVFPITAKAGVANLCSFLAYYIVLAFSLLSYSNVIKDISLHEVLKIDWCNLALAQKSTGVIAPFASF